jgi:phosphatidylglycerophosphate synthase
MQQKILDNIASVLSFLAMLVVLLVVLYVIDAHWLWSAVAVAIFAIVCVCRIIYESAQPDSSSDKGTKA